MLFFQMLLNVVWKLCFIYLVTEIGDSEGLSILLFGNFSEKYKLM